MIVKRGYNGIFCAFQGKFSSIIQNFQKKRLQNKYFELIKLGEYGNPVIFIIHTQARRRLWSSKFHAPVLKVI